MKRITSLLMLFLMCFCSLVKAQEVNYPQLSTAESPVYYLLRSYNRGGFLYGLNDQKVAQHISVIDENSSYYFVAKNGTNKDEGVFIYNKAGKKLTHDLKVKDSEAAGEDVWFLIENGTNNVGFCISTKPQLKDGGNCCIESHNYDLNCGFYNPVYNPYNNHDWQGCTWIATQRTTKNFQYPVVSTKSAPVWYTMASYDRGGIITVSDENKIIHQEDASDKALWRLQAVENNDKHGVYIINKSGKYLRRNKNVEDKNGASLDPYVWYIHNNGFNDNGFCISQISDKPEKCLDAANHNNTISDWQPGLNNAGQEDWAGTTWVFTAVPISNRFYYIKGAISNKYISGLKTSATNGQNRLKMTAESGVENIVLYNKNNEFVFFNNGLGIQKTCELADVDNKLVFEVLHSAKGKDGLIIKSPNSTEKAQILYDNGNNGNGYVDRNTTDHVNCRWYFENVESLPVTFKGNTTSGFYATISAPVALTLPSDVKAYIAKSVEGDKVNLVEIAAIPAATPVLLKAVNATEQCVKELTIAESATASTDGNLFQGGYEATKKAAEWYGLGMVDNVVGFYTLGGTAESVLKGFRARLPKVGAAAHSLSLSFGDVTGIEGIENVVSGKAVIYDLSGRRVAAPTKGLYIINGKKVLVK